MLEMGYLKSNLTSGEFYGKVQYQLADVLSPALGKAAKMANVSSDLSYKLLQKVHRENRIKTETFSKASPAKLGSVEIAVYAGHYPDPSTDPSVFTVYVNGEKVTKTTTATNNVVTFDNLPPGNHRFIVENENAQFSVTVTAGSKVRGYYDQDDSSWTLN